MATNYTLSDVAELEAALATGATRVTHGGTTTEYRTRDDMMKQLRLMKRELGIDAPANPPRIRRLRVLTTKGL